MSDVPPPKASPRPPDDSAPLARPDSWSGVDPRVIAAMERRIAKASNGKPVVQPRLVPYFSAGLTVCVTVAGASQLDLGLPPKLFAWATLGALVFAALLGNSPGWRKKDDK